MLGSLSMTGPEFVEEMNATLWQILSVRDTALSGIAESVGRSDMPQLLRGALRNEMEASEIAARWMPSTDQIEAKLAFAWHAGDQARHYRLTPPPLLEPGVDPPPFSPPP